MHACPRHHWVIFSFAGPVLDVVHSYSGLLAGRPVEADTGATRTDPLFQCAVQCPVARRHVPPRGEQAEEGHLCGESHESHRCLSAHVRQLLFSGECEFRVGWISLRRTDLKVEEA